MFRYGALKLVSVILRIFGTVSIILGVLSLILAFSELSEMNGRIGDANIFAITWLFKLSAGFVLLSAGLWNLAFGQMILVFIDTANNTRSLVQIEAYSKYASELLAYIANQPPTVNEALRATRQ